MFFNKYLLIFIEPAEASVSRGDENKYQEGGLTMLGYFSYTWGKDCSAGVLTLKLIRVSFSPQNSISRSGRLQGKPAIQGEKR